MDQCEGRSTALSMLLSRLHTVPRAWHYNIGCNMLKFLVLRFPWMNYDCLIASNRFHYHTHKCNVVTDPDSYNLYRHHKTSTAESINRHWTFSKSHVWVLSPENLIPYLAIRSVLSTSVHGSENRTRQMIPMIVTIMLSFEAHGCAHAFCANQLWLSWPVQLHNYPFILLVCHMRLCEDTILVYTLSK